MRVTQQAAFQKSRVAVKPRTANRVSKLHCSAIVPSSHETPARSFIQSVGLSFAAAAVMTMSSLAPFTPPADALLTSKDPIKNAQALLRNALPIDNKSIRSIQEELEGISETLRIPGNKSLGPVSRAVRDASSTLSRDKNKIIAALAPNRKADGLANIEKLEASLARFQDIVEAKDKQQVPLAQREALSYVGAIEEDMMSGMAYSVPPEYADLPQLLGRAKLQALVHCESTPIGPTDVILDIVLDGYNAPVSAGSIFDLVQRKFYDNMEIQRSDGFVVQTGDPAGPDEGFRDPATNEIRRIPLEVRVFGESEPIYEFSLEDLGRFNEQPVLPFNAYGTIAIARNEFENNSGSSQIFFLLKESELTPSGSNLLDGRYAVIGYVVDGQDALGSMKVGDKIKYIKIISGAENFKPGKAAPAPKEPEPAPAPAIEEAAAVPTPEA